MIIGMVMMTALLGLGSAWLWSPDASRTELEARYAGAPSEFLEVEGVRLHVRVTGPLTAPAVILLHGFGASLHTWEDWSKPLANHFRVIRYDLPGAGLSGTDATGDYSDARSMQILLALMDRLGLERASLMGHSMGGRVAWNFAATYPQRVDKLILVSPDGFASPGFEYGKAPKVPASFKLMRFFLPKALLRMSLEPAYSEPTAMNEAVLTRYHDLMLAPGVRTAMIARMEQSILQDPRPVLAKIKAQTLLVWGERDAMIPFENSTDYLRALPSATLVNLPEVGHLPHEEVPEKAIPAIQSFLLEKR